MDKTEGSILEQPDATLSSISIRKRSLPAETVSLSTFCEFLGYLSHKEEPPDVQMPEFVTSTLQNLNPCLAWCFHDILKQQQLGETSTKTCTICSIIHAQICHFGNCIEKQYSCGVCLQLYRIMQGHIKLCRREEKRSKLSSSDMCFVLLDAMSVEGFSVDSDKFWFRLKKVASEIVMIPLDDMYNTLAPFPYNDKNKDNSLQLSKADISVSEYNNRAGPIPASRRTSKANRKSVTVPYEDHQVHGEGYHIPQSEDDVFPTDVGANHNISEIPEYDVLRDLRKKSTGSEAPVTNGYWLEHMKYKLPENVMTQDLYDTQKTYGESGAMSLPMDQNFNRGGQQFSSLEMRPVGQPGIGEVVYGTREQLRLVADHWSKLKDSMKDSSLPSQTREEGVIVSKYKKKLCILRTVYQKHYQWERLSHLGNGAAGKCHLAMDLTSNFKFCVKRLNIHNYAKEELKVWCDLEHPNIVHLFGALRVGEKIYILSEFIDGGNLTACINEQKAMNHRLSHVMALIYFRQLLKVLVYLKAKGIIHEDIKCDNILLRRGSPSIAVCDFGLSRYINQEKDFKGQSPAGTSTQWSPEKAASYGHGFPSEVWAAICVLVHIMSGDPPWLKRYSNAAMLHFIIFQKSPPMEDVPATVKGDMLDLIRMGFAVKEKERPTACILLNHPVFKEIVHDAPEKYYSIMLSERPPLMAAKRQQIDRIVENLQEIISSSDDSSSSGEQYFAQGGAESTVSTSNQDKFQIRSEVVEASSKIIDEEREQPASIDSNDLPKLSILEKIQSVNDKCNSSYKQFTSSPHTYSQQTIKPPAYREPKLNDKGEIANTAENMIFETQSDSLANSQGHSQGDDHVSFKSFSENLFPSVSTNNPSILLSPQEEKSSIYQNFLQDKEWPNAININKPTLTLYERQDEISSPVQENVVDGNVSTLPDFVQTLKEEKEPETFAKAESPIFFPPQETLPPHVVPGTEMSNDSSDVTDSKSRCKSPTSKHKPLHLDITKPVQHPKTLPIQSAPVISDCPAKHLPVNNAAQTAVVSNQPETLNSYCKCAASSSELEKERVKLLEKLDIDPTSDQDVLIQDVKGEDEDWKDVLTCLQKNIPDQSACCLKFYDESCKELICSVRADPAITDWKDLFETSPIVQKIQEENVYHFTIFYFGKGEREPVDHSAPIDKEKTDLSISPTTPESHDCWCHEHLNV